MHQLKYIISESLDPYYNLALENSLLLDIKEGEKILLLYKNIPSIVLGRFQNPWIECDIANIIKDDIKLVRRQSGGGTVYHDLENINFCFINAGNKHDKDENNEILVNALLRLEVKAYASGRSDLMVEKDGEKKISGSAFKQKKESSFHHGTMLINSDLTRLNNYLNTSHKEMEGRGIKSVRSKVLNIIEVNHNITEQMFFDSVIKSFEDYYNLSSTEIIYDEAINRIDGTYLESLKSWEWIFGETPFFKLDKSIDGYDFEVEARKGKMTKFKVESNALGVHLSQLISERFQGLSISKILIEKEIQMIVKEYSEFMNELERLKLVVLKLFGF